ncbi:MULTISPECIES: HAD family hydrolase [unclassified Sedimentibacter]|uniref:HAD family hydrolase n=1 Tax=unclassified Sedimentibacter TaxID=2649220 RepID=UPI0027DF2AA7|nr:HAD hydrolase-like protein [Sedimentibacter sp. MB35-C1]WMJ78391.1 HAD hydrolase-like protein [Sedimentibacter sp. MB35-C1]
MIYTHIIWDFNGTLLDDVMAGIKSENVLLSRRNMPLIENIEQYHKYFCFPIVEYYKKLGHDFDKEDYNDLAIEWVTEYLKFSRESMLHDGIREALDKFKSEGCRQIILSASEKEMLTKQVRELNIHEYFDEILGLDNIHAYSKSEMAKEWVKGEKPRKALFIGDTTHDYEVACGMNVDCVLVAKGHQSRSTLLECGVPVFDTFYDMLSYWEKQ